MVAVNIWCHSELRSLHVIKSAFFIVLCCLSKSAELWGRQATCSFCNTPNSLHTSLNTCEVKWVPLSELIIFGIIPYTDTNCTMHLAVSAAEHDLSGYAHINREKLSINVKTYLYPLRWHDDEIDINALEWICAFLIDSGSDWPLSICTLLSNTPSTWVHVFVNVIFLIWPV